MATVKEKTIKWLMWHIDEMVNNQLGQTIPEKDQIKNEATMAEINECIKWVRGKKDKVKNKGQ